MKVKVAVIYHSVTGNTYKMAQAVVKGVEAAGGEPRLRQVPKLLPEIDVLTYEPLSARPPEPYDISEAQLEDLEWADAYIFGTPARFGAMSAQLKQFLDSTGSLWVQNKLSNKVAAAFTSVCHAHGGHESTILTIYNVMYHWGDIIVAPGYTNPDVTSAVGNPYGASHMSTEKDAPPTDPELGTAFYLGKRVTIVAQRLVDNPI